MMKPYLLFYYRGYYPKGAFNDYVSSFETKEDVFNYISTLPNSLKELIDRNNIELQVFNIKSTHVLAIDDMDLLNDVLDDDKYTPPENSSYFEDLIEDCELEDKYDNM